ncbi:MAG TPA: D-aminoacylase [Vicinamibacterales bacterium]|jgi:N-acyl-D-amino-acid deacylase|nr:D-aminoacylase [Vicinamibacterales bacterium]
MKTLWTVIALLTAACSARPEYDVVIRHGVVYDGSGSPGATEDLAIQGDRIVARGALGGARGRQEVDASGLAVAPGFIDMLNHSETSLMADGRSQSGIRQGVTLSVFGESSMGPLSDQMKKDQMARQGDIKFAITWTTLGEFLDMLAARGVSTNIASFVSASTIRANEIGYDNRPPTEAELDRMRTHVRRAMSEGAMGLTTALIYTPAVFAKTDELVELAKVASESGGMYISHMRSEGNRLLEAIDETLAIARQARIRAEIYHLKAAGQSNWGKLGDAIAKIEAARAGGLEITADMYTYTAGSTGLDASMPPWAQEGGYDAWARRLRDPKIRARVRHEMVTPGDEWENLLLAAGGEGTLLVGFKNEALRVYTGKTLAEVSKLRGTSLQDTAMDLVVEDGSRVQVVYFLMSEDNVKHQIQLPWVSFGSDASSMAAEGVFLKTSTHPRAYGNFARLLGKYVRDERVIPIQEAIRKLTSLPADTLRVKDRGRLAVGAFADVVIFDPKTIADRATYEQPHQYATGVLDVWVNGVQVLKDGAHTGATPGRVVRGPGWRPRT